MRPNEEKMKCVDEQRGFKYTGLLEVNKIEKINVAMKELISNEHF